jgi:hypothetical protein
MAISPGFLTLADIATAACSDATLGVDPRAAHVLEILDADVRSELTSIAHVRDTNQRRLLETFDATIAQLPDAASLDATFLESMTGFVQGTDSLEPERSDVYLRHLLAKTDLYTFRVTTGVFRPARYEGGIRPLVLAAGTACGEAFINVSLVADQLGNGIGGAVGLAVGVVALNAALACTGAECARERNRIMPKTADVVDRRGTHRPAAAALGFRLACAGVIAVNAAYASLRFHIEQGARHFDPLVGGFTCLLLFGVGVAAAALVGTHRYRSDDPIPDLGRLDRAAKKAMRAAKREGARLQGLRKTTHTKTSEELAVAFEPGAHTFIQLGQLLSEYKAEQRMAEAKADSLRDLLVEAYRYYEQVHRGVPRFGSVPRFSQYRQRPEVRVAPPLHDYVAVHIATLQEAKTKFEAVREKRRKGLAGFDQWMRMEVRRAEQGDVSSAQQGLPHSGGAS